MRHALLAAVLIVSSIAPAAAGEPAEYVLKMPPQAMRQVFLGLAELPYKNVAGIIAELDRQVGAQQAPPAPVPPAAEQAPPQKAD